MKINLVKLHNLIYSTLSKIFEILLILFDSLYIRVYIIVILSLNIFNWILVYYFNKNVSNNLVILHYNINIGVNLIGQANRVYLLPFLGFLIFIINFILLIYIYKKGRFIVHLLLATLIVVNIFLLASVISLYLINIK